MPRSPGHCKHALQRQQQRQQRRRFLVQPTSSITTIPVASWRCLALLCTGAETLILSQGSRWPTPCGWHHAVPEEPFPPPAHTQLAIACITSQVGLWFNEVELVKPKLCVCLRVAHCTQTASCECYLLATWGQHGRWTELSAHLENSGLLQVVRVAAPALNTWTHQQRQQVNTHVTELMLTHHSTTCVLQSWPASPELCRFLETLMYQGSRFVACRCDAQGCCQMHEVWFVCLSLIWPKSFGTLTSKMSWSSQEKWKGMLASAWANPGFRKCSQ